MFKWTTEQQNAIDARDCNILVSAAAGSGKTAVLVERVVKMITDEENPVDVDRLLVVTFTNAAAAEMKARISKSLRSIISQHPNNTNALRQLSLLPNARICTIDSFCINLVRENFFKLNIDRDFSIMDNSQAGLVSRSAVDDVIENCYKSEDSQFRELVEMLSNTKNDSGLVSTIQHINTFIMSQAFPFDWLDEVTELYNPETDIDSSELKKFVFSEIHYYCCYAKDLIYQALNSLTADDELFEKYSDMLSTDLASFDRIDAALSGGSWDEVKAVYDSLSFSSTPYKRDYTSPSKGIVVGNKALYKDVADKEFASLLCVSSEEYHQDCCCLYSKLKLLCGIIREYNAKMEELKHELNSYTFSDIEHFAIELLFNKDADGNIVRTELAREYEDTFAEILVDEYQDTNSAQDTLFEMLSNGRNRFMVGDVKQSIYRFRLAMPFIFTNKKDEFESFDRYSACENQKIIFDRNYRSRHDICSFTNFVFTNLMSRRVGELDYNQEEYLNPQASFEPTDVPSIQLNIVETPESEDAAEFEARQTASLILDKIHRRELIKDGDVSRPIRYGDIAVLFRAAKNRIPIYSRVLSEYGIPVISNNKINLFENNEISILISLLRVVDNPDQDIPLLATLMSVFYGYSADDISFARLKTPKGNLYSAVCSDCARFSKILKDIERYREYASSMSVEGFIRQVISDTSYLSIISAMGNHEQSVQNVMKLISIAAGFDRGENVGLTAFMRYIDSIIDSGLSVESASVSHSTGDGVMLMSIHQSKGLEFPVCILADASHKYNTDDLKNIVQLNSQSGIGLKVYNDELMYRYNSLQYSVIKYMNSAALISECLRVLYVAITRAKEQFIVFISDKNPKSHINKLSAKIVDGAIPPQVVKHTTSDADMLLLCALIHRDGGVFREFCDAEVKFSCDTDFDISIAFPSGIKISESDTQDIAEASDELVERITQKLSFRYERKELSSFSSKRTASSLDEKENSLRYFATSKPAFLDASEMTQAERGTAMHAFMQYCDYRSARDSLDAEIIRLTENGLITQKQADSLDRQRLSNLFDSDFAQRIFESDMVYREIKVSSFVPVSEFENTKFSDGVLVQGIADCVFEEDGELVLVDYKTDKVTGEEELLDRYKKQISFYRSAVSKALDKPVKEALLYSFSLNKPCIYKK